MGHNALVVKNINEQQAMVRFEAWRRTLGRRVYVNIEPDMAPQPGALYRWYDVLYRIVGVAETARGPEFPVMLLDPLDRPD